MIQGLKITSEIRMESAIQGLKIKVVLWPQCIKIFVGPVAETRVSGLEIHFFGVEIFCYQVEFKH